MFVLRQFHYAYAVCTDVIHEGAQRRILLRCREFPGGGEEQNFGKHTTLRLKLEGEEIGREEGWAGSTESLSKL